nr:glutathione S transferase [Hymenolepis microstoma]
MAPILAYWNIRGLAEMSRLMMHYHGDTFEDRQYVCGPAPDFDRSDWTSKKFTLGLAFPNLPYYIDGEFKITQAQAILEFLADKHDMIPFCKKRKAQLRMLNNQVTDFRNSFVSLCYNPDYEKLVDGFKEKLADHLKAFELYLTDKKWLDGKHINFPDFNLCELLNQLVLWDSKCLDAYPHLKAYLNRFENLPNIKEYMESTEFRKRPCNNKQARWGSSAEIADQ